MSIVAAMTAGAAQARTAPSSSATHTAAAEASLPATCVVHSLASFVAQGEFDLSAMAADIVEVECNPYVYGTGSRVKIMASQLFSRCKDRLTWYVPNAVPGNEFLPNAAPGNQFQEEKGRGISVGLDADGSATVALLAGPECEAGEGLITAHMEQEPFESFTTSFTVLPPVNTPPGVFALPASQVEDAGSSAVATIVEAEFRAGSEKPVRISSEELYQRCRRSPHLIWIGMNGSITSGPEVRGVQLDNNGNAFVIAVGDSSCAEGASLIEADLESKPFTTFTTNFTIQPPQPTAEPSFTIEKLQQIAGSASGFTAAPLKGALGQTVDYEIVVKNTANVAETFSEFSDPHCDAGTILGGPGSNPVAAGQATTWTCHHTLTAVGSYTNEAMVTGTSTGGTPVTHSSNQVVVEVPLTPIHLEVSPPAGPGVITVTNAIPGKPPVEGPPTRRVLTECVKSRVVLRGASGPKSAPFTLEIGSPGIKQITFYLDGRKLKTLKQSQAKRSKFTINVDPRKLSYGTHKVSIKTLMVDPNCASISRSGAFVRPHTQVRVPRFPG